MPSMNDTLCSPVPLLLMLDYDGTLVPITPHFEDAWISKDTLDLLARIAQLPGVQLAIVSGRSVSQLLVFLHNLIGYPIYLVGLHGGEVYDLQNQQPLQEPSLEYKTAIATLKAYLIAHHVHQLPGIVLEDKGYSLGVHYRLATDAVAEQALAHLREGLETQGLAMDFILRPGKKLLEAVPKGFHKGIGVEELLELATQRFGHPPHLTYVGDDITDFDAFRAVNAHSGMAIYVGSQLPPEAPPVTQVLPDIAAVRQFLQQCLAQRTSDSQAYVPSNPLA